MSFVPLGSMLQAKKNTPATRAGACRARIKAMQAPSLQPTIGGFLQVQRVHHGENVGRHQLICKRPRIARAAAVATAIDEHGAMAGADQRRDLIAPVAAMAEAAMQQDDGEPDPYVAYQIRAPSCST